MPKPLTHAAAFNEVPGLAVTALTTPEQFVLGVCRCWDAFMEGPDRTLPLRELAPVFAYMNVLGALCAFERTFAHLHACRSRPLRFLDVDCVRVGADEARLLGGLACLQRGHARETIGLLENALTSEELRAVLPPLARIASILDARGHRLPQRL
jgi:hypothetical protein